MTAHFSCAYGAAVQGFIRFKVFSTFWYRLGKIAEPVKIYPFKEFSELGVK